MPIYDHKCKKCNKISEHLYSNNKDIVKEPILCPFCNEITERLISNIHFGWERKIYKTFVNAEDERAEAEQKDHMGKKPYSMMPDEQ